MPECCGINMFYTIELLFVILLHIQELPVYFLVFPFVVGHILEAIAKTTENIPSVDKLLVGVVTCLKVSVEEKLGENRTSRTKIKYYIKLYVLTSAVVPMCVGVIHF
jgi:hypothetical protein